ncbi:hypothetical protein SUGI_0632550 [Cryptomeria japonica]|uniref:uncharacterized protein LOC131876458 n=1 Tax=Cryptomeria japonica TaxID=3369 RepID=UPI0024146B15|nr:uncharacterized protein LOC131876458 [Cryptomeria japonica]GLJ31517.1 hypothetical protein SUGI_0632550 [Cryptomeria japonica]
MEKSCETFWKWGNARICQIPEAQPMQLVNVGTGQTPPASHTTVSGNGEMLRRRWHLSKPVLQLTANHMLMFSSFVFNECRMSNAEAQPMQLLNEEARNLGTGQIPPSEFICCT